MHERAHRVFARVLDLPPADRVGFLESVCEGDSDLRRAVERLLRAADKSGGFLDEPVLERLLPVMPIGPSSIGGSRAESLPDLEVPGHRLVRVLGSGGMATVYEAEQQSPARRVAVKVMQLRPDQDRMLQRFLLETELLARLDHPNIARIFAAGKVEHRGRVYPWYSMELIDHARTITAFAGEEAPDLRRLLQVFLEVCDAVGHGHQAGVIHRDLKPGNVLLDAADRPKLIDFGIARWLTPGTERITLDAERSTLIGTLNYMSPEQCGDTERVDTRSDVYALGVLLFELLSGRLPHDFEGKPLPVAVRSKHVDPPRRLGDLVRGIPADLDAIVMQCLEVEPDHRYGTAADLAADLRRFLQDEPVQARSPTAAYQLRKLARRHRMAVVAISVVLLSLVGGVGVATRMAVVAGEEREAAEKRTEQLREVVDHHRRMLEGLDVPSSGFHLRRLLLEQGLSDEVLQGVDFSAVVADVFHQALLEPSLAKTDETQRTDPMVRVELLRILARTLRRLGRMEEAGGLLDEAVDLTTATAGAHHRGSLDVRFERAGLLMGLSRWPEAVVELEDILVSRQRALQPDDPLLFHTVDRLGWARLESGDLSTARRTFEQNLEWVRLCGDEHGTLLRTARTSLAASLGALGDIEGALEQLQWTRDDLSSETPDRDGAALKHNLGIMLLERGEAGRAIALLREAVAMNRIRHGMDHAETLRSLQELGGAYREGGQPEKAIEVWSECARRQAEVLGATHASTLLTRARLLALEAEQGRVTPDLDEIAGLRQALRKSVGALHARTTEVALLEVQMVHGSGDPDRAAELAREGLAACRAAMAAAESAGGEVDPKARRARTAYALTIAQILIVSRDFPEAEELLLLEWQAWEPHAEPGDPLTARFVSTLTAFYRFWDEHEPGRGHDLEADRWSERSGR